MIEFINLSRKKPYSIFKEKYDLALKNGQKNIEAMSISTYNTEKKEVDSRYVNLKFIDQENFIFFTNYNSPKSLAIKSHNQISALFFWQTINIQIRINAKIYRTTEEFNMNYFKQRSKEKNALAISSNQSQPISSYEEVRKKYNMTKNNGDLDKCPNYWGGFTFKPFSIEFWEGNEFRLNKRSLFIHNKKCWIQHILEP